MRVWLTCFILLFGAAELFQWMKQFSLPLPVFILGGVFLAVASNYDKLTDLPFHLDYEEPPLPSPPPNSGTLNQNAAAPVQSETAAKPSTRPVSFTLRKPSAPSPRSISFTIRKPGNPLQQDRQPD
ncbi:hypothetical protein ACN4EK_07015 [Pantanalinema rosaneae CENA516]|uniref:hypothetical protein n=1 Tax=Pantanalinema rosaneae TaxID=1620701 RepID=UPI003D6E5ADC